MAASKRAGESLADLTEVRLPDGRRVLVEASGNWALDPATGSWLPYAGDGEEEP